MKTILIVSLALSLLFGATANIRAADAPQKAPAAAEKAKKVKYRPFRGTIKSIETQAKTITLEGAKAQQFQIISETKLNKDGKPITFDQLAKGDRLGGRAREAANGKWDAVTINVRTAAEKSGKGAKGKKKTN